MEEPLCSKIGTFYVSTDMTLRTIRTDPDTFNRLMRKSIYISLSWLQRYVMLSNSFYNKKLSFITTIEFNMETNTSLIRYCSMLINTTPNLKPIIMLRYGKWTLDQIVDDKLYITEILPQKYLITTLVQHDSHQDLIPISELSI